MTSAPAGTWPAPTLEPPLLDNWRNGFAALGSAFFTKLQPCPLPAPY